MATTTTTLPAQHPHQHYAPLVPRKATRHKVRARIALDGPSGTGKTFTALRIATALGQRILIIQSESGTAEKYLGLAPDGIPWEFDVIDLPSFSPSTYTEAVMVAGREKYDVVIIDSLSHAWEGEGGALELVGAKEGNKFTAWKDVTPMHNRMVRSILHSPCHVIATMRSKTEYVMELNEQGKSIPRKVGMAPIQRQGMEYEFDLYGSLDWSHVMRITKSRCPEMDQLIAAKPGSSTFEPFVRWLNDGSDAPASFFAVSDEDLGRLQKSQDKAKPPTAQELLERAAAKGRAQVLANPAGPGNAAEIARAGASAAATEIVNPVVAAEPKANGHAVGDTVGGDTQNPLVVTQVLTQPTQQPTQEQPPFAPTNIPPNAVSHSTNGPLTTDQFNQIKAKVVDIEQSDKQIKVKLTGLLKSKLDADRLAKVDAGKMILELLTYSEAERLIGLLTDKQREIEAGKMIEGKAGGGKAKKEAAPKN